MSMLVHTNRRPWKNICTQFQCNIRINTKRFGAFHPKVTKLKSTLYIMARTTAQFRHVEIVCICIYVLKYIQFEFNFSQPVPTQIICEQFRLNEDKWRDIFRKIGMAKRIRQIGPKFENGVNIERTIRTVLIYSHSTRAHGTVNALKMMWNSDGDEDCFTNGTYSIGIDNRGESVRNK